MKIQLTKIAAIGKPSSAKVATDACVVSRPLQYIKSDTMPLTTAIIKMNSESVQVNCPVVGNDCCCQSSKIKKRKAQTNRNEVMSLKSMLCKTYLPKTAEAPQKKATTSERTTPTTFGLNCSPRYSCGTEPGKRNEIGAEERHNGPEPVFRRERPFQKDCCERNDD